MSLFQCDYCGCVDNTALTSAGFGQMNFFLEKDLIQKYKKKFDVKEDEKFGNYCSECSPLGEEKWHGEFDRVYLPKEEFETDDHGDLRHKKTLDTKFEKYALKIEKE